MEATKYKVIHKKGFNLFTSIYMIRMVGTFLSVHLFSRILFNNKVDLENNTLKIFLDILIPFFILLLFRYIERTIFYKKTDQPINKNFWKELFLGNWNHEKILEKKTKDQERFNTKIDQGLQEVRKRSSQAKDTSRRDALSVPDTDLYKNTNFRKQINV